MNEKIIEIIIIATLGMWCMSFIQFNKRFIKYDYVRDLLFTHISLMMAFITAIILIKSILQ